MTLTVTDMFCGAGGSSSGAETVPGVTVRMAANHWQLAVDSHNANFPDADHDCADISATDPRRYPTTDILWASPECTNHSQAKGIRRGNQQRDLFEEALPDEAAERSRATMWDVARFAERHHYRAIVVENVVDVRKWIMWDAWLMAMCCLGYEHQVVYLNSMFAWDGSHAGRPEELPAPQSRDRLYVVFWRAGDRAPDLDFRLPAWCPACEEIVRARQSFKRPDRPWGRYRAQYTYRCPDRNCQVAVEPATLPAAMAIDWTMPGQRIGDRAKPLADKTRARIAAGIARYARPSHLEATESKAVACPPLAVPVEGRNGKQATPVTEVLRTQTARLETALVEPFVAELRGGSSDARPVADPLATVVASGNHHGLVEPPGFVMRNNRGGAEMCTPFGEPLRTVTTTGHQSVVTWAHHLLVPYYGNGTARTVHDPMGTVTAKDRQALVGMLPDVDDCLFRMLEPAEVHRAMAFHDGYRILGNRRERVRMLGNAVTPPAARLIVLAVVEALTGAAA
ncbi:MAG: DNA cytosine methyltransferase [Chloroflexi bacterium]|nr:DNA cytosine methyltransferase [Chloroflexota bacterium]